MTARLVSGTSTRGGAYRRHSLESARSERMADLLIVYLREARIVSIPVSQRPKSPQRAPAVQQKK